MQPRYTSFCRILVPLLLLIGLVGCLPACSFYPLAVVEAPRPEGWPGLTPVGKVEVKQYPAYRAAVAEAPGATLADGKADDEMFGTLFNHIKSRDIPMTAPVVMDYQPANGQDPPVKPEAMAFLYRTTDVGETGEAGEGVRVVDVAAQTYISVGTRGRYSEHRFLKGVEKLQTWLETTGNEQGYTAAGPARLLGYNSPFVPRFFRYGEVQMPVNKK